MRDDLVQLDTATFRSASSSESFLASRVPQHTSIDATGDSFLKKAYHEANLGNLKAFFRDAAMRGNISTLQFLKAANEGYELCTRADCNIVGLRYDDVKNVPKVRTAIENWYRKARAHGSDCSFVSDTTLYNLVERAREVPFSLCRVLSQDGVLLKAPYQLLAENHIIAMSQYRQRRYHIDFIDYTMGTGKTAIMASVWMRLVNPKIKNYIDKDGSRVVAEDFSYYKTFVVSPIGHQALLKEIQRIEKYFDGYDSQNPLVQTTDDELKLSDRIKFKTAWPKWGGKPNAFSINSDVRVDLLDKDHLGDLDEIHPDIKDFSAKGGSSSKAPHANLKDIVRYCLGLFEDAERTKYEGAVNLMFLIDEPQETIFPTNKDGKVSNAFHTAVDTILQNAKQKKINLYLRMAIFCGTFNTQPLVTNFNKLTNTLRGWESSSWFSKPWVDFVLRKEVIPTPLHPAVKCSWEPIDGDIEAKLRTICVRESDLEPLRLDDVCEGLQYMVVNEGNFQSVAASADIRTGQTFQATGPGDNDLAHPARVRRVPHKILVVAHASDLERLGRTSIPYPGWEIKALTTNESTFTTNQKLDQAKITAWWDSDLAPTTRRMAVLDHNVTGITLKHADAIYVLNDTPSTLNDEEYMAHRARYLLQPLARAIRICSTPVVRVIHCFDKPKASMHRNRPIPFRLDTTIVDDELYGDPSTWDVCTYQKPPSNPRRHRFDKLRWPKIDEPHKLPLIVAQTAEEYIEMLRHSHPLTPSFLAFLSLFRSKSVGQLQRVTNLLYKKEEPTKEMQEALLACLEEERDHLIDGTGIFFLPDSYEIFLDALRDLATRNPFQNFLHMHGGWAREQFEKLQETFKALDEVNREMTESIKLCEEKLTTDERPSKRLKVEDEVAAVLNRQIDVCKANLQVFDVNKDRRLTIDRLDDVSFFDFIKQKRYDSYDDMHNRALFEYLVGTRSTNGFTTANDLIQFYNDSSNIREMAREKVQSLYRGLYHMLRSDGREYGGLGAWLQASLASTQDLAIPASSSVAALPARPSGPARLECPRWWSGQPYDKSSTHLLCPLRNLLLELVDPAPPEAAAPETFDIENPPTMGEVLSGTLYGGVSVARQLGEWTLSFVATEPESVKVEVNDVATWQAFAEGKRDDFVEAMRDLLIRLLLVDDQQARNYATELAREVSKLVQYAIRVGGAAADTASLLYNTVWVGRIMAIAILRIATKWLLSRRSRQGTRDEGATIQQLIDELSDVKEQLYAARDENARLKVDLNRQNSSLHLLREQLELSSLPRADRRLVQARVDRAQAGESAYRV